MLPVTNKRRDLQVGTPQHDEKTAENMQISTTHMKSCVALDYRFVAIRFMMQYIKPANKEL